MEIYGRFVLRENAEIKVNARKHVFITLDIKTRPSIMEFVFKVTKGMLLFNDDILSFLDRYISFRVTGRVLSLTQLHMARMSGQLIAESRVCLAFRGSAPLLRVPQKMSLHLPLLPEHGIWLELRTLCLSAQAPSASSTNHHIHLK